MIKRIQSLYIVLLSALLLALTACSPLPGSSASPVEGALEVHFLDVGQGDAALLLCDGASMLIDGGNVADSSLVAAYLQDHEISRLDYIVCTHGHEDHVGGLSGALNTATVDTVFSPVQNFDSKAFRDFVHYTKLQGNTITIPAPGDRFSLGSAQVEVLAPLQDYEDTNNTSIVLKITHGSVSFLFTGDAESLSEEDMIEAGLDLNATVLKVGHHGSNTSTSYRFLREVLPEYAVISVGEGNSYGHPHEEVLSRLRDADVTLYRTDMQGHIIAISNGERVAFTTQRTAKAPTNPTEKAPTSYYIGNLRSLKVHLPTCTSLPAEQNQIRFDTLDEALKDGYSPCSACRP